MISTYSSERERTEGEGGLNNKCWHKVGKIFVGVRFCSTKTIPTQLVFMQCVQRGFFAHYIPNKSCSFNNSFGAGVANKRIQGFVYTHQLELLE